MKLVALIGAALAAIAIVAGNAPAAKAVNINGRIVQANGAGCGACRVHISNPNLYVDTGTFSDGTWNWLGGQGGVSYTVQGFQTTSTRGCYRFTDAVTRTATPSPVYLNFGTMVLSHYGCLNIKVGLVEFVS